MLALLCYLAWGLIVFQAFAATGRFVARAVGSRHRREVALPACWGLAAMTLLGGWLNLLGLARSSVLIGLTLAVVLVDSLLDWRAAIGIASTGAVSGADISPRPPDRWSGLWIIPLLALVGVKYLTSLAVAFNSPDDQPAYLLQVARMIQTGSIGIDPFSARQLMSLNGQTFLAALLCSVAPLSHVFLLDPGIGWVILAAQTWSMIRRDLGGSPAESCLLTSTVLMADAPFINVTGYLTSTVLFLALIRTVCLGTDDEAKPNGRAPLLLALTVAGLGAVKTTSLYYGGFFLIIWYGSRLLRSFRLATVRELCAIGLVASVLLLPWMWQQYLSGGTPFYPLLGKGHHVTGPGLEQFKDSPITRAKVLLYYLSQATVIASVVATAMLVSRPFRVVLDRWHVLSASLISATVGSMALAFYMASNAIGRYTYGFLYAALIAAGVHGFFGRRGGSRMTGVALCLAVFVGAMWVNIHSKLAAVRDVVRAGRPVSSHEDGEERRIREAQSSIPEGRTVLICLQNAFLLDFSRNPVLNLDQPGMASPPPGLPITDDPTGLADFLARRTDRLPPPGRGDRLLNYLRDAHVDYLMFQRKAKTAWYNNPGISEKPYWNRMISTLANLVLEELKSLIPRCTALYDDGDLIVLDLRGPAAASDQGEG